MRKRNFSRSVGYLEPYNLPLSLHGLGIRFSLQKTSRKNLAVGCPALAQRAAASPGTPEKAAGIFTFPTGMIPAQQGLGTASELLPAPSPGCSCPCLLNWFCSVPAGTGPVTGMENTVQGHNPTAPRNNTEGKPTLLTTGGKSKINPKQVGNSTIPVQSGPNSSHGGDPDLVPALIPTPLLPHPNHWDLKQGKEKHSGF